MPPSDPLVTALRTEAAQSVGGGVLLIFGGVLASLFTVAAIVILIGLVVGWGDFGFWGWFILFAVLFAGGAVAWLRTRPKLLAGRAFEYTDPRQEWAGLGQYDGATAIPGLAADAVLIGPRMVQSGITQASDKEPPSRERFFDRCALLLRQMAKAGEAVRLPAVQIGEDETPDKLRPVTAYLDRAGWIGQSSDGGRLWLSSRAKVDLVRLGVPIGAPEAE